MNRGLILAAAMLLLPLSMNAADVVIKISGNDQMQFDVKEFKVKAGAKVKLEFKHSGKLPKVAMGHNVVILKKGLQAVAEGPKFMAGGTPDNGYIPDAKKGDVIASTKLLGGGESDTIEFTAPAEKGEYQYLCTFPGHFGLMNGKMVVE
jgi:azurin